MRPYLLADDGHSVLATLWRWGTRNLSEELWWLDRPPLLFRLPFGTATQSPCNVWRDGDWDIPLGGNREAYEARLYRVDRSGEGR